MKVRTLLFCLLTTLSYASLPGEAFKIDNNYQLKREKDNIKTKIGLQVFKIFKGHYGISTDGWGGRTNKVGKILAYIPPHSNVVAAYLYAAGVGPYALDVYDVNFSNRLIHYNDEEIWNGEGYLTGRKDVTNIVKNAIKEGACNKDGNCTFSIMEKGYNDGEALVIIYQNYSLPESTIAILDGHARMSGDKAILNLEKPVDKVNNSFYAHMYLGISYSYDVNYSHKQFSRITVNDKNLTKYAGSQDDGYPENGGLITVGSFYDPFTSINTNDWKLDHEKYDITSLINDGDKQIRITTYNSSHDDNIFLVAYRISQSLSSVYIEGGPNIEGPENINVDRNQIIYLEYNITNTANAPIDINISFEGDINELNSKILNPEILNSTFEQNETKILKLAIDTSKLQKTDNKIIIIAKGNNIISRKETIVHLKTSHLFSDIELTKGWNLLGAKENVTIEDIKNSLEEKGWKLELVYKYENHQWLLNIVNKEKFSNTIGLPEFDKVSKEEGIWVYIVPKY